MIKIIIVFEKFFGPHKRKKPKSLRPLLHANLNLNEMPKGIVSDSKYPILISVHFLDLVRSYPAGLISSSKKHHATIGLSLNRVGYVVRNTLP